MQEYGGEAVALRREPQGESDSRISLFTERYGKLTAKAKSARKITSKLSAHLEPGTVSEVRLVEKNDMHVVDALKKVRLLVTPSDLYCLDRLLGEADPDPALWQLVRGGNFSWGRILALLGWDPLEAACGVCGALPAVFHIGTHDFFCRGCATRSSNCEFIMISNQ